MTDDPKTPTDMFASIGRRLAGQYPEPPAKRDQSATGPTPRRGYRRRKGLIIEQARAELAGGPAIPEPLGLIPLDRPKLPPGPKTVPGAAQEILGRVQRKAPGAPLTQIEVMVASMTQQHAQRVEAVDWEVGHGQAMGDLRQWLEACNPLHRHPRQAMADAAAERHVVESMLHPSIELQMPHLSLDFTGATRAGKNLATQVPTGSRIAASAQIYPPSVDPIPTDEKADGLYAERGRLNAQLDVWRRTARPTDEIKARLAEIDRLIGRYENHLVVTGRRPYEDSS